MLSDPEKRAAYDQLGRGYQPGQDFRPPPDWDAGFEFSGRGFSPGEAADFSDFFAELFGRADGGHGGFPHTAATTGRRGEDHHAKVLLDIEDAFTGATRQISLRAPQLDAQGRVSMDTRTLNVKIPNGVREGQIDPPGRPGRARHGRRRRRRPDAGGALQPHPRFRVDGRDLHLTLPVAPWEAALGAVIAVELPQGAVKVRIPEGAQSGKQLRVRGKGIPGEPPGDLLLDCRSCCRRPTRPRRGNSTKPWRASWLSIRATTRKPEPCETKTS